MATLAYLSQAQDRINAFQAEEMEAQESRVRREDDFGETDDELGGVTVEGYKRKSRCVVTETHAGAAAGQRQATLAYLTQMQEDIAAQELRVGETDDELGGVTPEGNQKKSQPKWQRRLSSVTLNRRVTKIQIRKTKDRLLHRAWLDGLE